MKPPRISFDELVRRYCETQDEDETPSAIRDRVCSIVSNMGADGMMLLQFCDMSCSLYGGHVLLAYGERNTYKDLPDADHIIHFHPHGLTNDYARCVGYCTRGEILNTNTK